MEKTECFDWTGWLNDKGEFLESIGYVRNITKTNGENSSYFKNFKGYEIRISFFHLMVRKRIEITTEYKVIITDMPYISELIVKKDLLVTEFEAMAQEFYEFINK